MLAKTPTASGANPPDVCDAALAPDGGQGDRGLGMIVRICGVSGAKDLDGELATCKSWDDDRQRWLVTLHNGGGEKFVKPDSLKVAKWYSSQPCPRLSGSAAVPALARGCWCWSAALFLRRWLDTSPVAPVDADESRYVVFAGFGDDRRRLLPWCMQCGRSISSDSGCFVCSPLFDADNMT